MSDRPDLLQQVPARKKTLRRKIVAGIAGFLVVGAAVAGVVAINLASAAEEARSAASKSAQASQSAEASKIAAQAKAKAQADLEQSRAVAAAAEQQRIADAAAKEQKNMEALGWTHFSDQLYYIVAPASSVYCGSIACAGFSVVSQNPLGCPGGIWFEASFLANGNVSVGHSSHYTGALGPGQQANFKLYDTSGAGQVVDVTSMQCR